MNPVLMSLIGQLGVALAKWATSEIEKDVTDKFQKAEQERSRGIRNGENQKRYQEAQSRKDQMRAAIDLINRNDT